MCLYIIGKHWGSFLSHCIYQVSNVTPMYIVLLVQHGWLVECGWAGWEVVVGVCANMMAMVMGAN